jgi:hypothetical protein
MALAISRGRKAMDLEETGAEPSEGGAQFAAAKLSLSVQFGVGSAFVRVSKLAEMMGLPGNSIRAAMRGGSFPIARHRVGKITLVRFDDFVRWYCEGGTLAEPAVPHRAPRQAPAPEAAGRGPAPGKATSTEPVGETEKEKIARWKREIKQSLRDKGLI